MSPLFLDSKLNINEKINLRHNHYKYWLKNKYWVNNCGKHDLYNTEFFYWHWKRKKMSKKLGYVEWFDASGEGMIFCPRDNSSYYVHYSAIKNSQRSLLPDWKNLNKKHPVEFTLYENLYMKQVDSVWPLEFNYTVENEHKLQRLMNETWEAGSSWVFDLADIYYGGSDEK
jgi:cold shock CspA family protein